MDPLPTLDLLLDDATVGPDSLRAAAAAAVVAAVDDLAAVDVLDRSARTTDWLGGARLVAVAVREQYERWAMAAEALRQRVERVAARAGAVAGADRLEGAIGRTAARLAVPLDEVAAAARDARAGRGRRFASVEEMRRELLHPAVHPRGDGAVSPARPAGSGSGA